MLDICRPAGSLSLLSPNPSTPTAPPPAPPSPRAPPHLPPPPHHSIRPTSSRFSKFKFNFDSVSGFWFVVVEYVGGEPKIRPLAMIAVSGVSWPPPSTLGTEAGELSLSSAVVSSVTTTGPVRLLLLLTFELMAGNQRQNCHLLLSPAVHWCGAVSSRRLRIPSFLTPRPPRCHNIDWNCFAAPLSAAACLKILVDICLNQQRLILASAARRGSPTLQ